MRWPTTGKMVHVSKMSIKEGRSPFALALFIVLVVAASLLLVESTETAALAAVAHEDADLLEQVLEWTRAQGAFISDKIEIRQIYGDLSGLYAKVPLKKGEIITSVPWDVIFRPKADENGEYSWCDSVEFIRSLITKDADLQNPYERYLSKRKRQHVPMFWSAEGKALLKQLVDNCMLFVYDLDHGYAESCQSPVEDSHLDAMMILQTRGEGPYGVDLIPVHDLLNHRVRLQTIIVCCLGFHFLWHLTLVL